MSFSGWRHPDIFNIIFPSRPFLIRFSDWDFIYTHLSAVAWMSIPRRFHFPWCYALPYTLNPKTWATVAHWNKCLQFLFWAGLDISLPPPLPSSVTLPLFCCWKTGIFSRWRSCRNVKSIFPCLLKSPLQDNFVTCSHWGYEGTL